MEPVARGRYWYSYDMCIICIDLAKGVLTGKDARRHLGEMRGKLGEHASEVQAKIEEAEQAVPPSPSPPKP